MPRTCTICGHEQRRRIEVAMLEQAPLRDIARRWGVSKDAASRHRKDHIPKAVIQGREDEREFSHFKKLKLLEKTLFSILTRRLVEEDDGMVLRVHGSLLKHYAFELQLGEIEAIKREIEELKDALREREDTR